MFETIRIPQTNVTAPRSFGVPFKKFYEITKVARYMRTSTLDISCDLFAYQSGLAPGASYRIHIEQAQA